MKTVDRKRVELGILHLRDNVLALIERNGLVDSGRGDVRGEFAILRRKPEPLQRRIDVASQLPQFPSGIDTGPQHARLAGIWKPSQPVQANAETGTRRYVRQRFLELVKPRFGPLADEPGRDVQIIGGNPLQMSSPPQSPQHPRPDVFATVWH